MDVYRYPRCLYGQSDELAKQMFAQQALSTGMPYQRTDQEAHTMPAPSSAPWNIQDFPRGMTSPPSLVQFTAHSPSAEPQLRPMLHCKRKSLDVETVIPAKQMITEEKMAAHLSGLHISSDYISHSFAKQSEETMDIAMESTLPIGEKLKGHKIILSEEIKKMQEEPLLPASLIERFEKPHMSLVVWQPRENIFEKIIETDEKTPEEEQKIRHGVLVSEPSGMEVEML